MAKTKWRIEPGSLTIYPKRILMVLSLVVFVILAAGDYFLLQQSGQALAIGYPFMACLFVFCLIIFWIGDTRIVFDGSSRMLYRKLSFLTIGRIPFDQIAAVEPYQVLGSGFNYRLFKKSNRHGKGLILSAGYSKMTSPNLIAFQQEVLPKIDELVFLNAPAESKPVIYDFDFFKNNAGVYTLRNNKIGSLIFSFIMIGLTVVMVINPGFMADEPTFKRILVTFFPLIIGLALLSSVFRRIVFDQNQKKITDTLLGGLVVRTYDFDELIHFQIVRKTTNFIYSGTEVRAQLFLKSKNKSREMVLKNFTGTKKIERFLDEANTILGRI